MKRGPKAIISLLLLFGFTICAQAIFDKIAAIPDVSVTFILLQVFISWMHR